METETKRVALVTGASGGLGLETARQLANKGIAVLLTSRNAEEGQAAADSLRSDKLSVEYHRLDVTSEEDIESVFQLVMKEYGRLEILVNNAGVRLDPGWPVVEENIPIASALKVDPQVLRDSYEINTLGAYRLCQRFIPLMQEQGSGRIVNVSTMMGQLSTMNGGWPGYRVSKVALNGVTRVFAKELEGTNVLINSASPGWVRTKMGGPNAPLSVEEGADTIVWLATLPDGGPSGGFFEARREIAW